MSLHSILDCHHEGFGHACGDDDTAPVKGDVEGGNGRAELYAAYLGWREILRAEDAFYWALDELRRSA